jgi:nucleoside-diphosphate-sugar epimerase
MKVVIIGGTTFVGRILVSELVKAGHEVSVLHRRAEHDLGRKVSNIQCDRRDHAALARALSSSNFEVVFDTAYDWEHGTTAADVDAAARACGDRLQRYIFISSVAAYGDGLNHHEGDALAPDDYHDTYARNKATSERLLFRMHQRCGFPVVSLRPPFVYGPGNPFYREAFFWDRLRDGRAIILPGDGRRLMQFVFVKDLVWACMRVMDHPSVVSHAFNIANSRPLTQTEVVLAFAEAAGKKVNIVRLPRERILRAGGHAMGPMLYFGEYFDVPPITQVITKAQRVLGFKPTEFARGLKETYRDYLRNHHRRHPDYAFEDALLARTHVAVGA